MLRVAVPNKGVLAETANEFLREAGYHGRRDPKELVTIDPRNDVEFFYLRPRDIATYVGSGVIDVGITGRDFLLDADSKATEIRALDFGNSRFRFAAPAGEIREVSQLSGKRIATSLVGLLDHWLREHEIRATLVKLDGAVESSIRLGVADVVADVVETGTTLRKAGLEVFGPVILESTAVLISTPTKEQAASTLLGRFDGVLVARRYALMDYDVQSEHLEQAVAITPGYQSPTISPLRDTGWFAVRAMVPTGEVNQIMDALHALGARAIIVTALQAARM